MLKQTSLGLKKKMARESTLSQNEKRLILSPPPPPPVLGARLMHVDFGYRPPVS